MSLTRKSVSVSQLKARLSEYLRRVKAGETVLVTERGRPIVEMKPLPSESLGEELTELVEAGLVRPSTEPLPEGYWEEERPADPEGAVRRAIIEEREEGR